LNNHTSVCKNVSLERADPRERPWAVRTVELVWRVSVGVTFPLHHRQLTGWVILSWCISLLWC